MHQQGQRNDVDHHLQRNHAVEAEPPRGVRKAQREHRQQITDRHHHEHQRCLVAQAHAAPEHHEHRRHDEAEDIEVAQRGAPCDVGRRQRDVGAGADALSHRRHGHAHRSSRRPLRAARLRSRAPATHNGRRRGCARPRPPGWPDAPHRAAGAAFWPDAAGAGPSRWRTGREEKRGASTRAAGRGTGSEKCSTHPRRTPRYTARRRAQAASSVSSCLAKQKRTTRASWPSAKNADSGIAATPTSRVSHSTKARSGRSSK